MKILGILILVIGIAMTLFTAVNFTTREKVVDMGPVEIMHDKPQHLDWSPYAGVLLIVVGGLILWKSPKYV